MLERLKDPISAVTHMIGAFLSLLASVFLVYRAATQATGWHVVSFAVYGASLIALYTASALYHSLQVSSKAENLLKQLDHAMIYFLIAGTYTPVCLVVLRGGWGWSLFGINWALAIAGIILKLVFRNPPKAVVIILFTFYILMGWLVVVAWFPLIRALPQAGVFWLILGGLFYTFGTTVLNIKRLNFSPQFGAHEIWHFFVMAGSFCHFWLMFNHIAYIQ